MGQEAALNKLGPALIRDAVRSSFIHFQRYVHPVVSGEPYIHALHTRAIAGALDRLARGDIRRLMIAVPPRHFKSYLASVALPAYLLGLDPGCRIICGSYGGELADNFAAQTRMILRDPRYQTIFPDTRLSSKTPPVAKLKTTANGYRIATSIGGVLTGIGCDVAIIDDPMKAAEATSQHVRDAVGEWFKGSLMTRFDNPSTGRLIVVMQRLHQDDLIGRLKSEPGWEVLELPAVAPSSIKLNLGFGDARVLPAGHILFPERFDHATLAQLRHDLGEAGFSAQMLQKPTPGGGHLFDLGKVKRFSLDEIKGHGRYETLIMSVDCAAETTLSSDYTAITTWLVIGRELRLVGAARGRWTLPRVAKELEMIQRASNCKKSCVLIENGGSGIPLRHELQSRGWKYVFNWQPKQGKIARAELVNLEMEKGVVLFPVSAPWLEEVETELCQFPHGKNDDYVDSISQVVWNLHEQLGRHMNLSAYPSERV